MIKPEEFVSDIFEMMARMIEEAVAAERAANAKMVDHILKENGGTYGDAIRARGQP